MSTATCIIPNCRKVAPAHEPFCSDHRDKARGREDWREPYRSMDAGGSDTAAENVGWRWIDAIAKEAKRRNPEGLEIHSPTVAADGRAIALYRGTKLLAVATIFRDPMNFAVLVRWRGEAEPPGPGDRCGGCGKAWEEFAKTTTCGMGGCPWGGDI